MQSVKEVPNRQLHKIKIKNKQKDFTFVYKVALGIQQLCLRFYRGAWIIKHLTNV